MRKNYYESLPRDYFGDLYSRVSSKLSKGENVCISVMPGFGANTFLNFFARLIKKDRLFENVYFYDPTLEKYSLIEFIKEKLKEKIKHNLLIVKGFEKINKKSEVLEILHGLRQPGPKKNSLPRVYGANGYYSRARILCENNALFFRQNLSRPF